MLLARLKGMPGVHVLVLEGAEELAALREMVEVRGACDNNQVAEDLGVDDLSRSNGLWDYLDDRLCYQPTETIMFKPIEEL